MIKFTLLIVSIILGLSIQAQDYKIDFTASGITNTLDSVHVKNLAQQTELTLNGVDTLHLDKNTGIGKEHKEKDKIRFYPNPLRNGEGKLRFYQNKSGDTKVEVYDIEGKLLLSKQGNLQRGHNEFMFTGMPTGFFMVQVKSATISRSLKIISIDGKQGIPEMKFVQNVQANANEPSTKSIMAVKSLISMQYNDAEALKMTGFADSLISVDTLIPTQSQTVDFHFGPTVAPVSEFIASDTLIQIGDTIDFTDQSTNNPTSWSWDFGDGNTLNVQHPVHVYDTAGTFTVSLTVTNNVGSDTETRPDYITVSDTSALVADFSVSDTNIQIGDTINFTDQSNNNPTSWSWDFGDGDTSDLQHPVHVYKAAGTFTVSLKATNNVGSDTETKTNYIFVTDTSSASYPSGTVYCILGGAAIVDVSNPTTGKSWMDRNLGASRVAQSSTDDLAYGALYQWGRFSDGHQCRNSSTTNTNATTAIPNANNSWDGKFITESSPPYDWLIPQNDFLWQGLKGYNNPCPSGYRLPTENEWNNERLSWTSNNSTGAYGSQLKLPVAGGRAHSSGTLYDIDSYGFYWCSTVSGTQVRHFDFYNSLAYILNCGRGKGFSIRCIKDDLSSTTAPIASFSVSDTIILLGDTIDFFDQSSNIPESWSWDFGDGDTSNVQHPFHAYSSADTFSVSLTVSNPAGSDTKTRTDYITVIDSSSWNYPSSAIHCIPGETAVMDVINPSTSKIWMDRNLGATRVAQSSTDSLAYGDLYQWGRFSDGHQCRNSGETTTKTSSDTPGHGDFIKGSFDWRSPQNNNLWQGVNGTNNPCPSGYRLPTQNELNNERQSWSSNHASGAYGSPLKLPVGGYRNYYYGSLLQAGSLGLFWSSTVDGTDAYYLDFRSSSASMYSNYRAKGHSVRCLKD